MRTHHSIIHWISFQKWNSTFYNTKIVRECTHYYTLPTLLLLLNKEKWKLASGTSTSFHIKIYYTTIERERWRKKWEIPNNREKRREKVEKLTGWVQSISWLCGYIITSLHGNFKVIGGERERSLHKSYKHHNKNHHHYHHQATLSDVTREGRRGDRKIK